MTSLKHLLNDEDQVLDGFRSQPFSSQGTSSSYISSDQEDTPPTLQDGSWGTLFTELHGRPFDPTFEAFDLNVDELFAGTEQWQLDVEKWGVDTFVDNNIEYGKVEDHLLDNIQDGLSEVSSCNASQPALICYGLIHRAAVKLTGDMSKLRTRLNANDVDKVAGHAVCPIGYVGDDLWLLFNDGTGFAQLNAHLSKILPPVLNTHQVELDGLVDLITLRQTVERATKSSEAMLRVGINVYGSHDSKHVVGKELSKTKVFLQQPEHPRHGFNYDNPHFLELECNIIEETLPLISDDSADEAQEPVKEDFRATVNNIYKTLKRGAHLRQLDADISLQTPLLTHQREALDFMIQREAGPIEEQFCLWQKEEQEGETCYRHIITNSLSHDQPPETGGGVLADAMGLGKTLSILSLVAKTREAAHSWSSRHQDPESFTMEVAKQQSRATLVLVSSYRVVVLLNHWLSEVERHLDGTFEVIKHHGQRREKKIAKIADSDIVITTYHTLAAEMADGKSPLHAIAWYRIVLDEAHIIRHRHTTFYQTCLQLDAVNRWCLTGTPIQNTLDDIGALFSFIKVRPFDSIGTFRSLVTITFDESLERRSLASERLTALLDSLCLRRTRDVVDLPEQKEVLRELDLSEEEREQYQQTKSMMNRAIRQRFGEQERKNVFGLFQAQLQLRLLCNHGTFQNPFSWTNHRNIITERESALDLLSQSGEIACACCGQPLPVTSTNSTFTQSYTCRHVCCLECLEQSVGGEDFDDEFSVSRCPVCETGNKVGGKKKQRGEASMTDGSGDYFRTKGHSTKMRALVSDVEKNLWACKSVIFSCWTRTLDLVGRHFVAHGIPFKRIDGNSPLHARQDVLDDFSCNPKTPVLLMTTGTGAFGLNIPIANRIFIVESQWNPHTERQAIARAMRLGQQHPIVVYRYVVNHSVEQEMRSQQQRKLLIAEVGW